MTRRWTPDEERRLQDYWQEGVSVSRIACRLNRTWGAVDARRRLLEKRNKEQAIR
jgi:hypothetical protein